MSKFKKVTLEEYCAFINSWQGELVFDINYIYEPPLRSYNDFSGEKKWPESIVAKQIVNDNEDEDKLTNPQKYWEFFILAD